MSGPRARYLKGQPFAFASTIEYAPALGWIDQTDLVARRSTLKLYPRVDLQVLREDRYRFPPHREPTALSRNSGERAKRGARVRESGRSSARRSRPIPTAVVRASQTVGRIALDDSPTLPRVTDTSTLSNEDHAGEDEDRQRGGAGAGQHFALWV